MTRTAPTIADGTQNITKASFRFIDNRGDLRTVTVEAEDGVGLIANVEAVSAALAAGSNANLYSVKISYEWASTASASAANNDPMESVYDNVVINYKDITINKQQSTYIPAPLSAIVGDGDKVVTTNVLYTAVRGAYETLIGLSYTPVTARFTERREKNDSTPA